MFFRTFQSRSGSADLVSMIMFVGLESTTVTAI